MKVYLEAHGCPVAFYEANKAVEGLERVNDPSKADAIVLFACAVKEETEKLMKQRIRDLCKYNKKFAVIGCLVDVLKQELKKECKNIILVSTSNILETRNALLDGKDRLGVSKKIKLKNFVGNYPIAIIPIAEGCLGNCTYCATKIARPLFYSYPKERIIDAVFNAVDRGYKEIWITAQDTSIYGFDIKSNIAELLSSILNEVEGNYFIRLGMGNPKFFLKYWKELKEIFKHKNMFKMLHIPVQSGSNKVLKDMRRMHTKEDFEKLVFLARKDVKNISIWTDIIVGYPTEKEEDFKETLELIEKTKPEKVNVSRFGMRKGTEAYKLKDLPPRIKKERSRKLISLINKYNIERNEKYLNKTLDVLIDEENAGRTSNYLQVAFPLNNLEKGKIVKARIVAYTPGYLLGMITSYAERRNDD